MNLKHWECHSVLDTVSQAITDLMLELSGSITTSLNGDQKSQRKTFSSGTFSKRIIEHIKFNVKLEIKHPNLLGVLGRERMSLMSSNALQAIYCISY